MVVNYLTRELISTETTPYRHRAIISLWYYFRFDKRLNVSLEVVFEVISEGVHTKK